MDPNNPYQQNQPVQLPQPTQQPPAQPVNSLDYLNSISAQPVQTGMLDRKFKIIFIILGVVSIIVAGLLAVRALSGPDATSQANALYVRITSLQTVLTSQQKHLSENAIVNINATMSAALASMESDIKKIIEDGGEKAPKTDDKSLKPADLKYKNDLISKFNDAYLTGTLDRGYASEMAYQMSLLKSQMQKYQSSTGKKSAEDFYERNAPSLDMAIKSFSDFAATK